MTAREDMTRTEPTVAEVVAGLTKAEVRDLHRAICTAGVWWVPCPEPGHPLLNQDGSLTADGLAVRELLLAKEVGK